MWNLPIPDLQDSIADLNDIESHSDFFDSSHIPSLITLYNQYHSQGGKVSDAQHDSIVSDAKKGLKLAYPKTYKNREHSSIRRALLSLTPKCPMCGVGNAKTLDHYMEKSRYVALSMMRQNLVPMCRDCNTNRENNDLKHSDFLHAYYDLLPVDQQWLKVNIIYGGGAINAIFYPDPTVLTDPILLGKVQETIKGIEFNDTVGAELHSFLSSTLSKCNGSDIQMKILIRKKAKEHADKATFGLNHWKTVLLKELASYSALTQADLKQYL